jgi:hypothetical protein
MFSSHLAPLPSLQQPNLLLSQQIDQSVNKTMKWVCMYQIVWHIRWGVADSQALTLRGMATVPRLLNHITNNITWWGFCSAQLIVYPSRQEPPSSTFRGNVSRGFTLRTQYNHNRLRLCYTA